MNEYLTEILIGLIALISGIVTGLFSRKSASDDQIQKFLDRYETLIIKLERENSALKEQILDLGKRLESLQRNYETLNSLHLDIPMPLCIVTKSGTMTHCNKAYEELYLKPLEYTIDEALGMDLVEIFGIDIGLEYMKGWNVIHKNKEAFIFAERVLKGFDSDEYSYQRFMKYPLFTGENATFAGVMIGLEDITKEEYEKFKPKKVRYYR